MPELPEVEKVTVLLREVLDGRTIKKVEIFDHRLRYPLSQNMPEILQDMQVQYIWRRGKYILCQGTSTFDPDRHFVLIVHLGMSGHVHHFQKKDLPTKKSIRVQFILDNDVVIVYRDPRKFGSIQVFALPEQHKKDAPIKDLEGNISHRLVLLPAYHKKSTNQPWVEIAFLGPEPFSSDFEADRIYQDCLRRRTNIKSYFMNQKNVAGIGNAYSSEILHDAHILPTRNVNTLTLPEWKACVKSTRKILTNAIKHGIPSIDGKITIQYRAEAWNMSKAYGNKDAVCPSCGKGIIQRITQSNRSSYFCPNCQV